MTVLMSDMNIRPRFCCICLGLAVGEEAACLKREAQ